MDLGIEWIKTLIDLMNQNDLVEVELEEEGRKVRLKKGDAEASQKGVVVLPAPVAAREASARPPSDGAAASSAAPPRAAQDGIREIRSPMVGTFYRSPSPEAPPFVEVGDTVSEESVVCIIEAMKVMNEIKAEVSGVVKEILSDNGEAVEYGTPLFRIKVS